MNKLEFAKEMAGIARRIEELRFKNDFNKDGSEISREKGNYYTKWYLTQIISRSYDAAKSSICSFIEDNDIRDMNDEELRSFKLALIELLSK